MHPARVIIDHSVLKHIRNLRNCYSTIRRNCENKKLCCLKDLVVFIGHEYRYTVNSREHVTHFECVAYHNTGIFKQNIGDL